MLATGKNLALFPGTAVRLALDFLLPLRCLCCDAKVGSDGGLCARCWQSVPFLEKPWCYRLGIPFTYDVGEEAWSPRAIASPPVFDRLRSVAYYDGPARDLILALKFSGRRELAVPMGRWMSRAGCEFLGPESLVLPVPLHWSRLLSRRFNQSADLAKAVAKECGGQFDPGLLKRRKRTRQQVGLSAKDRRRNVRSAFGIEEGRLGEVDGRHAVLIDDVMTTGSTVTACTKVLLAAGAASVNVLTFALADPANASRDDGLFL